MKYFPVILAITAVIVSCQSSPKQPSHQLPGEWDSHETFEGKPWHFQVRFKSDGSFDGLGNGKLVISGQYRTNGDTIFFKDAICNLDYEAAYRLTWFSDSIRFNVIADTCQQRINGSDKVALGRVK